MLNVIWDFEPCWGYCGWRPYAGGGVGFTFVETNLSNNGVSLVATEFESNSAFAWQLMAGISRPLSAYTDIFVEYRYFSTDAIRLQLNLPSGSAVGDIHYQTDNVFFGIRMNF
jgi:opacity protein-like surface antigen